MVSARQIRAARGLLDWSQEQLAEKSNVTRKSIRNAELGVAAPRSDTANAIKRAFENYGIEFLPNDGLRMKDDSVTVLEGEGANERLLEDIFQTLRDHPGEEILISGLREPSPEDKERLGILERHLARLQAAGITERLLIEEGDTNFVAPHKFYRWIPAKHFTPTTMQLYGNKLAMISWGPPLKIFIIQNPLVADSYRALFNFSWEHCTIPDIPKKKSRS